ncbi:type II restriction endonuclease [Arenimonas caeni]|uniref:Restriction endonuclease n=1 Tax=Arenimonas caeni TaxID=2058085 RepID=A0A2P6M8E0_9GAMM|nr:type II restriction endonuclease [Arenimonas caeni]PRH82238.1 restriction endonuclease [Arenimonas caeni]
MKRGYLSEYFEGVAIKRLSAVEADQTRSNQHEYNATREMLAFLGRPSEATRLDTRFIYLSDEDDEPVFEDAFLTLYDSRENQAGRSAEYRFYFPTTRVSQLASQGDLLLIAKRRDGGLLVIIAEDGSSAASQLEWLFGFSEDTYPKFSVRAELENEQDRVGFAATFILESIGVAVTHKEETLLDTMLSRFGGKFPKTTEFSAFARETLAGVDPREDADAALMAWMEREEILFRTLERHLIAERLSKGFAADSIDDFVSFSLSVQNRRKSRVGYALENHLEVVFDSLGVKHKRGGFTENKSRPDFLFPGETAYHDPSFDESRLSMLAVKSTCKDRWRQALAEADRISTKHLLTLEAAISPNQTNEMKAKKLQLVVPSALHGTYNDSQRIWLMNVRGFADHALILQTTE